MTVHHNTTESNDSHRQANQLVTCHPVVRPWSTLATVTPSAVDETLAEFAATPGLPGAACRGQHPLFDNAVSDPDAQLLARRICADCPCLTDYDLRLASLPAPGVPLVVTAGQLVTQQALTNPNKIRPIVTAQRPRKFTNTLAVGPHAKAGSTAWQKAMTQLLIKATRLPASTTCPYTRLHSAPPTGCSRRGVEIPAMQPSARCSALGILAEKCEIGFDHPKGCLPRKVGWRDAQDSAQSVAGCQPGQAN